MPSISKLPYFLAHAALPVLKLDQGGGLVSTNAVAGRLLQNAAQITQMHKQGMEPNMPAFSWWEELSDWVTNTISEQPFHISHIPQDHGVVIIEWLGLRDKDGWVIMGRDCSAEQNLRDALIESRQRFRDLVDLAADFVWETDARGKFTYISNQGALGYRQDQLVGQHSSHVLLEQGLHNTAFESRKFIDHDYITLRSKRGQPALFAVRAKPVYEGFKEFLGVRGVCFSAQAESQELARAQLEIRLRNQLTRLTAQNINAERLLHLSLQSVGDFCAAQGGVLLSRHEEGIAPVSWWEHKPHDAAWRQNLLYGLHDLDHLVAGQLHPEKRQGVNLLSTPLLWQGGVIGAALFWREEDEQKWQEAERALLLSACAELGFRLAYYKLSVQHLQPHTEAGKTTQMVGSDHIGAEPSLSDILPRSVAGQTQEPAVLAPLDFAPILNAKIQAQPGIFVMIRLDNLEKLLLQNGSLVYYRALARFEKFLCQQVGDKCAVGRLRDTVWGWWLAGQDPEWVDQKFQKLRGGHAQWLEPTATAFHVMSMAALLTTPERVSKLDAPQDLLWEKLLYRAELLLSGLKPDIGRQAGRDRVIRAL